MITESFMKYSRNKTIALSIASIALLFFVVTLVRALWYHPEIEAALPVSKSSVPKKDEVQSKGIYPSKLRIPVLGINAKVQYVGITTKGNMGVPSNFTDV